MYEILQHLLQIWMFYRVCGTRVDHGHHGSVRIWEIHNARYVSRYNAATQLQTSKLPTDVSEFKNIALVYRKASTERYSNRTSPTERSPQNNFVLRNGCKQHPSYR